MRKKLLGAALAACFSGAMVMGAFAGEMTVEQVLENYAAATTEMSSFGAAVDGVANISLGVPDANMTMDMNGSTTMDMQMTIDPLAMEMSAQMSGEAMGQGGNMSMQMYMVPSENNTIKVYPIYDGDMFDLGGRIIEVVDVGGHTAGEVVFIDHKSRIAYSGDACNGNTLLEFPNSLPIISYLRNLLHLKEHQKEFDKMYGGHEIFDASIVDEAIETVAKVVAGTDDKCERPGMMGGTVFYAAEKVKDGYPRVDGKHFNMSYVPEKVAVPEETRQIIRLPKEKE